MNRVIKEAINVKARRLGISPGLLFFAVKTLSEDIRAREKNFLKPYFNALVKEQNEIAEQQLQSRNKHEREKGEKALKKLESHLCAIAELESFESARISLLMSAGEEVKKLHYVIWDQITDEMFRIRQKYAAELDEYDVLQIIRQLCPSQIEQFKEHGNLLQEG